MLILVTERTYGSENGRDCQWYEAGETYRMGTDLARVFIAEGWGTEAPEVPAEAVAPEASLPLPVMPPPTVRRTRKRR